MKLFYVLLLSSFLATLNIASMRREYEKQLSECYALGASAPEWTRKCLHKAKHIYEDGISLHEIELKYQESELYSAQAHHQLEREIQELDKQISEDKAKVSALLGPLAISLTVLFHGSNNKKISWPSDYLAKANECAGSKRVIGKRF